MNEHNLIPITERSESEQREMRQNGGRKSGETRRRKKSMKSVLTAMLNSDVVSDEIYNAAAEMGVNVMDMTYQAAIVAALIKKAASGNVAAVKEIQSIIGEDNDAELLKLRKREMKLKEQKLGGTDEEIPDDGFLSALNSSASEDWTEDVDEDK